MNTGRFFLSLLLITSAINVIAQDKTQQRDPAKCNAEARGYWDAPPQFWEKFWKECPPVQVDTLEGGPVYEARADLRPKLERGNVPPLPADSKKSSAEVTLSVTISNRGTVALATVVRTCGDKTLDERAVETVKTWRFKPATRDDKAVAVRDNFIVKFERSAG